MNRTNRNKAQRRGYTLLELMIVLAIVAGAVVGVLRLFSASSVRAAAQREQTSISALVDAVRGVYATAPSYAGIAMSTVEHGAPLQQVLRSDGNPVSAFGGALTLTAETVSNPDDAFGVRISQLGTKDCAAIVPALAGQSAQVFTASSGNIQPKPGVVPNGADIATACSGAFFQKGQGTLTLVYYSPRATGVAAAPGPGCATSCAPQTQTQTLACPTGQVGQINQTRTGTCSAGACPSQVWGAWTSISSSCAVAPVIPPPPVVPPPVVPPPACAPATYQRNQACPSGQTGIIIESQALQCPSGAMTPWTQVSSTCTAVVASGCVAGANQRNQACPAGQFGQVVQMQNFSCDTNGNQVDGAWYTVSSNCTTTGTCRPSQAPDGQRNVACAAGQYGQIIQTLEKTSTCSSATAMPTGGPDTVVGTTGTCAACPAATTETQNPACPVGQVGSITQTRSKSYDCASAPTSLPAPTYSDWTTTSDTCVLANWRPAVRRTCSFTSQNWTWSGNGQTCQGARTSFGLMTYEEGESLLIANTNAAAPGPPWYNPNTPWEGMGLAVCDSATIDAALAAHPTPAVNGIISAPTAMNPTLASTSCNDPSATWPVSPTSVPDQCAKDLVDSPTTNSATCAAAYATATHSNEPAGVKAFHNITNDTCVVWNNAGTPGFSGTTFAIGCQGGSGPPTSSVPNIVW